MRVEATAVNQSGSVSGAFVCSFVMLQADDGGGPAAGPKHCSSNQRPITQPENTTSRGVKTASSPYLQTYARYFYRLTFK